MKQTALILVILLLLTGLSACTVTPPPEDSSTSDTPAATADVQNPVPPEGFSQRTIRFLYDRNGGTYEAALDILLPADWTVSYGYGQYEVPPYEAYAAFFLDGECVGNIGFVQYELPEGDDLPVQAIFHQITMGAVRVWNIHQHFDAVTSEDAAHCTALTSVLYSAKLFPDGRDRTNSGIVTYHPENEMYFALELIDGYKERQLLTEEQLYITAESITWRPLAGRAMTAEEIAAAILKKGGDAVLPDTVTEITDSILTAAQPFEQPLLSIRFGKNTKSFTDVNVNTLQKLLVAENDPNYISADGVIYTRDRSTLVAFPAGRTGIFPVPDGVTAIADGAFFGTCLSEVILPDSVTSVSENAFADTVTVRKASDG